MTVPLQMQVRVACTVSFDPQAGNLRKFWLRRRAGAPTSGARPFLLPLFTEVRGRIVLGSSR
jgi:hypothetical protein